MEHIIFSQVMKHLNDNNILVHYQHGFRSGHSCETQLLTTIEEISKTLDMRKQVDSVLQIYLPQPFGCHGQIM
jgi:hypothetical protein